MAVLAVQIKVTFLPIGITKVQNTFIAQQSLKKQKSVESMELNIFVNV